MIKILLGALLSVSLLSLIGCGEKENATTETMTKCEAGKCDTAMQKSEVPAQKCNKDAKDSE
jgi:hypothetical protein